MHALLVEIAQSARDLSWWAGAGITLVKVGACAAVGAGVVLVGYDAKGQFKHPLRFAASALLGGVIAALLWWWLFLGVSGDHIPGTKSGGLGGKDRAPHDFREVANPVDPRVLVYPEPPDHERNAILVLLAEDPGDPGRFAPFHCRVIAPDGAAVEIRETRLVDFLRALNDTVDAVRKRTGGAVVLQENTLQVEPGLTIRGALDALR